MTTKSQYVQTMAASIATYRHLHVLAIGHELRVEALELLLSLHQDLQVETALVDTHALISSVLTLIKRYTISDPFDVVLIDWDGDPSINMELLEALAKSRQRCLVVASSVLPSDLKILQDAGAWGCVSTTASSRQLYATIGTIARGQPSFRPIQPASLRSLRVKRVLVFYPELVEMALNELHFELSSLSQQILAHLSLANAIEIGDHMHRQHGTIRFELTTGVYPFLRELAKYYHLPRSSVSNQKEAFEVALMVGFFVYR